jgi:hypothetical protein
MKVSSCVYEEGRSIRTVRLRLIISQLELLGADTADTQRRGPQGQHFQDAVGMAIRAADCQFGEVRRADCLRRRFREPNF